MKKEFSKSWKRSKQRRKQRKYIAKAPLHTKQKFVSSGFSKELRAKYSKRSIGVRKGDKVKVMAGQYRGRTGKIERVSIKKSKAYITGIETLKKDGSKSLYPLNPSNLQITELNTEDKKRLQKVKTKSEAKRS